LFAFIPESRNRIPALSRGGRVHPPSPFSRLRDVSLASFCLLHTPSFPFLFPPTSFDRVVESLARSRPIPRPPRLGGGRRGQPPLWRTRSSRRSGEGQREGGEEGR
ncbi:unnamed protein product, partial [Musa textilis]